MSATIQSRILSFNLLSKNIKIWPLTLREEQRLKVFENKVQKRIFGLKRAEVAGGWR
jgi:hypothetical protein